jgi:PleD family two-component response regulator
MEMLGSQRARFDTEATLPVARATVRKNLFLVYNSARSESPLKGILLDRGYHVTHAETAEAALRIWAKMTNSVDLFLADTSVEKDPGIEQLLKLLQAENPRLRVLYVNDLEQPTSSLAAQSYSQQLAAVVDNCLS